MAIRTEEVMIFYVLSYFFVIGLVCFILGIIFEEG